MSKEYSFGIPGNMIWTGHMLMGALFAYIGYLLLNDLPIRQIFAILLLVLGSLAVAYHGHLMYVNNK